MWESDKDDVYKIQGGYMSTEVSDDDYQGENEEEYLWGEEDQASIQHLTKASRYQAKEGLQQAPEKGKPTQLGTVEETQSRSNNLTNHSCFSKTQTAVDILAK